MRTYGNSRNVLQPPSGYNNKVAEKKPSLEDILSAFIVETRCRFNKDEARLDNIETLMGNKGAIMKSLEVQLKQLASSINAQQKRNFQSDTEKNPKELCKVIILRNGKEVESTKVQEEQAKDEEIVVKQPKKVKRTYSISFLDNRPFPTTPLPFPQRFQKKKFDAQFFKFLDIFKKIHINIPFIDTLE